MADKDGFKIAKDYKVSIPFANNSESFYVKGANNLDWGMKKHLANIFDAKSGNTVMFAFDHGYFMGSVSGLERLDLLIPTLAPHIDVLMCTRVHFVLAYLQWVTNQLYFVFHQVHQC